MVRKRTKVARLVNQLKQLNVSVPPVVLGPQRLSTQQNMALPRTRSANRRRRKRGNRNPGPRATIPGGFVGSQTRSSPVISTDGGGMRIRHCEYWADLKYGATTETILTLPFQLVTLTATEVLKAPRMLASLAKAYSRYQMHRIVIEYRTSVGTNKGGAVYLSVDWDANDPTPEVAKVKAMWPQIRTPVWQSANLPLPARRLQDRKTIYTHDKPWVLQVVSPKGSDTSTYGEIYISYDISFEGITGNV